VRTASRLSDYLPVNRIFLLALAALTLRAQTIDTTTGGAWQGTYGADGQLIANDPAAGAPAYATVAMTGQGTYTWGTASGSTSLALPGGTSLASTYFAVDNTSFTIDVNLTDGATHKLTLWLCDWDSNGPRAETITHGLRGGHRCRQCLHPQRCASAARQFLRLRSNGRGRVFVGVAVASKDARPGSNAR
jgi:hypothetical protein